MNFFRSFFAGVLGLLLMLGLRIATLSSGEENSQDVYYHIAMADLGPIVYTQKDFPSLTMSCWRTTFSDKELAFHFILTGIRGVKRFLESRLQPPFNVEYAIFAIMLMFSFVFVLSHYKVRHIYLYTLALVTLAPFFTTRLELLRPHLFAMTLVFLSCLFFDYVRSWQRLWIPIVFGFAMAWSYSNPHFILLSAAVFAVRELRDDWRLAVAIPVTVCLGIVLGFTLHPQFPNTFINWKIQCVDVMLVSLSGSAPVKLGYELCPGNLNFFVEHWILMVLMLLNCCFTTAFCWRKARERDISLLDVIKCFSHMEILAFAFTFVSIIAVFGIFLAVRAVEYAVPFTLIATGLNMRLVRVYSFNCIRTSSRRIILVVVVCMTLLVAFFGISNYCRRMRSGGVRPALDFAGWLANSGIPKFTVIGNVNWSDFPSLFYAAPDYFYLAGVDPMFAYFAHPEKMSALELFRTGRKALGAEELFEITGARYIFVSKRNMRLASDMYKLGFVAIYQGVDGDFFDLALTRHCHLKRDGVL